MERNFLLAFVLLFLLMSFLKTSIRIRYIAPIIPAMVILSCFGLKNTMNFFRNRKEPAAAWIGTSAMVLTVMALFGINTVYVLNQFKKVDPLSYISGHIERDAYITKYRPEYPLLKYANQNLAEGDRILGLYLGNRRYYCDHPMVFGETELTRMLILASSAEDVKKSLGRKGYTHVIVHLDLIKKWSRSLTDRERRIAAVFFSEYLSLIKKNREYALFAFNPRS